MNEIDELAKLFPSLNSRHLQLIAEYVSAVRSEAEVRVKKAEDDYAALEALDYEAQIGADEMSRRTKEAEARVAELEAQVTQLRQALQFYANDEDMDNGEIARSALSATPTATYRKE